MPYEFKCRYNPDHPTSTSAQALGHHYRTEHADVHTVSHDKRVQCRHCGKVLASSSVSAHLQTHHGIAGTNGQRLDHRQHVTTPDVDPGTVISVRTMQTWYRCRLCGQEMTANNIGRHVHKTHHRPDVDWRELVDDVGQRETMRRQAPSVQCDLCGASVVAHNLPRHMQKAHNAVPSPAPPVPTATTSMVAAHLSHNNNNSTHHQHEPWKADDIVLPVVEQLTLPTGLLPVAQLAAVLAWRDATTTMLATLARAT